MLQGMKKPLNQTENPIYPDIKAAPPQFKWSGKHWNVDVGQTLKDTEHHTQAYENAILAQSRDYNKDHYGHTSYQEKIGQFRPPLQSYYEDIAPLNRLPTKIHKIQPRINPVTAHSDTPVYHKNNTTTENLDKYITDRISAKEIRHTFFAPIESGPEDNQDIVQPDLVTNLPSHSASSGKEAPYKDISNEETNFDDSNKAINKNQTKASASSGYNINYNLPISSQSSTKPDRHPVRNLPYYSSSPGINSPFSKDGETGKENIELNRNMPSYSNTSGINPQMNIDGETHIDELELDSQIDSPLNVGNSESEIQKGLSYSEPFTTPEEHMKLQETPKVSATSGYDMGYKERNVLTSRPKVKGKLEPLKSYGTGMFSNYIPKKDIERPNVQLKSDYMSSSKSLQSKV